MIETVLGSLIVAGITAGITTFVTNFVTVSVLKNDISWLKDQTKEVFKRLHRLETK